MKYSIGYQLAERDEEPFFNLIAEHAAAIAELYFAPPGMRSGRSPVGGGAGDAERMREEIEAFRSEGVKLNLLFNANCYAGGAMSEELKRTVLTTVEDFAPHSVTTTSLFVAHVLQGSGIEVRASVNMRIGTIKAMEYQSALFDGYYVRREFNRDIQHLRMLRRWADANGKQLYLLANSGCLYDCSGQTFHDNLVAHEPEVAQQDNDPSFVPYTCWRFLQERSNWPAILQATWIRPEDVRHYEGLVPHMKLATRLHERPQTVLRAYAEERYSGNLPELLEPGFSPLLAPYVIDAARLPDDWFAKTTTCGHHCHTCDYCEKALQAALRNLFESNIKSASQKFCPERSHSPVRC